MTTAPIQQEGVRNRVLARLPASEFRQLAPLLTPVSLEGGRVLYGAEEPVRHVYFVTQGVLSLVSTLDDGTSIAVGAVGREGLLDLSVLLGGEASAHQAMVQVGGGALRMRAAEARAAFQSLPHLRERLLRYTGLVLTLISQTAVCNTLHTVEERLARWLLVCTLRLDSDTLPLTHEFLAQMLGVRRSGVTVASGVLERRGVLRHSRGRLTILDRGGLRAAACECVRVLTEEYEEFVRD
jgi:CRP-like cAMP-binding protein